MTIQIDNVTNEIDVVSASTNASMTVMPKGTGAINLAPGSSGVNISNGNTVTAITRTAAGSGYTSVPTLTISAPTTAGGVTATASPLMAITSGTQTINNGGTGYTAGDSLTVSGGTGTAVTFSVATVSGGVITGLTITGSGAYSALPTFPAALTGGTGSGATVTFSFSIATATATITNAGSGYVEQPTVTFSGGGGSGAAAYAGVGSMPTIRSLAGSGGGSNSLSIASVSGEAIRITDPGGGTQVNYWRIQGGATGSAPQIQATGGDTNINGLISSKGTGGLVFYTNGFAQEQFRVAHTASAVNYVQVTGAATGNRPVISPQGSDTNIGLNIETKGTGSFFFRTGGSSIAQFVVTNTANSVNYINATGAAASAAPVLSVLGSDTNIDLNLTTKGTGAVRLNTGGGEQLRVSNTASAVNYVQVTGSATGTRPIVIANGSDANIGLQFQAKGTTSNTVFYANAGSTIQFVVNNSTGGANYLSVFGAATTVSPSLQATGTDTNIDLALTPKGTGLVSFGTHTATALTISGYIEIKDAGGTIRKLAVVT